MRSSTTGTTQLLPYDSLQIAEDADIYVGNPFSLVVQGSGDAGERVREIWISDIFASTVLQFDGRGAFVRRVGGPGEGPAEFSTIGQVFAAGKDEFGVVEFSRREVKWFGRDSAEVRRIVKFETGWAGFAPPVLLGTDLSLIFPLVDRLSMTSVGIYDPRTQRWKRAGTLPQPYRRSIVDGRGGFAAFYRYSFIDTLDASSVLSAFQGVDTLYRIDLSTLASSPLGMIPRRIRRGLEGECRFAADSPDAQRAVRECGPPHDRFSPVFGAWSLGRGRFAVVHTDQRAEGRPPNIILTGKSYLTVLDQATNTACVDLEIPGGRDARTVFDVEGNVLFILDRRVQAEQSSIWLLQVDIPAVQDCPADFVIQGWRSLE